MNRYPDNHQAQKNRYADRRSGLGGFLMILFALNSESAIGDSLQLVSPSNGDILTPLRYGRAFNFQRIRNSADAAKVRYHVFFLHAPTL